MRSAALAASVAAAFLVMVGRCTYLGIEGALANAVGKHVMLAPLTRGGNLPFRELCVSLGANVTYGEMASSRTLLKGRNFMERAKLRRSPVEKAFVAQIACKSIDEGSAAVRLAAESGCSAVDLNCGCPTHDITRRGLGASLLKKPHKLQRLVGGLADAASDCGVPLTVKVRCGWSGEPDLDFTLDLVHRLQDAGAAAVAIHGRTAEQRYLRAANWDLINTVASHGDTRIPVIGNGDALAWWEARGTLEASPAAGVLVGRGALIKPWIFREAAMDADWEPTHRERIGVYLQLALNCAAYFRKEGDSGAPDEISWRAAKYFLPWHVGLSSRHRPTPRDAPEVLALAERHPLIQSGRELDAALRAAGLGLDAMPRAERLVERALRCSSEAAWEDIARALWEQVCPMVEGLSAQEVPKEAFLNAALDDAAERAVDAVLERLEAIGAELEAAGPGSRYGAEETAETVAGG